MIWCPKCHYRTVLKRFFNDTCPQCRTAILPDEYLEKDPFLERALSRANNPKKRKFQFDQRGGSDTESPGRVKSVPTEKLGFYNSNGNRR
jgi:Zn-finger nucleic acid-binding protein